MCPNWQESVRFPYRFAFSKADLMLTYTEIGNQTNQLGPGLSVVRPIEEIDHDRIRATPEQGNRTSALGVIRRSREGGKVDSHFKCNTGLDKISAGVR